MNARPHNFIRSGFTLIELTLALAMVAIIAAPIFVALKMGLDAKASAEAAMEPSRTAELAMEFIRSDMQNAFISAMPSGFDATTQLLVPPQYLAPTFEGTDNTNSGIDAADLTFYSTANMKDHVTANGEIKQIELTLEVPTGSTQRCLVRKCSRNLLSENTVTPDEEILCRGVVNFTVQYFDGSNWDTAWDSTVEDNTLPAAVEVTMTLDRSTPQQPKILTFVRVFPLSCSTAAFDSTVNSGVPQ